MAPSRVFLALIPFAVACADDGSNGAAGKNSLINTSTEAPGDNCEFGGLKVETGLDSDGNGKLAATEVAATSYVCDGSAGADGADGQDGVGAEDVRTTVTAATQAQCPGGGQQIQFETAAGAPTGAPLVVCGADLAQTFGSMPYARATRSENRGAGGAVPIATEGASGPVLVTASITVPRAGVVVAQANGSAYCGTPPGVAAYGVCSATTANTVAFLTIVDASSPAQGGNSGEFNALAGIPEDRETQISVSTVFPVTAGAHSFNVFGKAEELSPTASTASVSYSTAELTLFFIPSAS